MFKDQQEGQGGWSEREPMGEREEGLREGMGPDCAGPSGPL